MFKILLALHLLCAIFAIGPLVAAATTASRALRTGDPQAARAAARTVRIYSIASLLVVIFGFGVMSAKAPHGGGKHVAEFSDTWIWLSALLWLVAVALALGVVVPGLLGAGARPGAAPAVTGGAQNPPATAGAGTHTSTPIAAPGAAIARVAAGGGVIGVIFAVIVFLMVYRPGS